MIFGSMVISMRKEADLKVAVKPIDIIDFAC